MHPALSKVDHRPWPLPRARWTWRQTWRDLLFAHWPVPAAALRPHVAAGLEVEEFDGTAWLAVVPFRMTGVMRRPLPDLPGISAFPELNVRTYVTCAGQPGVWFFSLDATNALAVWAARRWFHLPYYRAAMRCEPDADGIRYESRRSDGAAGFRGRYGPTGAVYESEPGSLEHFLTERYCLFAADRDGRIRRTEVHHHPWPLQPAELRLDVQTMADPLGLQLDEEPALLHFARAIDVVVWSPEFLGGLPAPA